MSEVVYSDVKFQKHRKTEGQDIAAGNPESQHQAEASRVKPGARYLVGVVVVVMVATYIIAFCIDFGIIWDNCSKCTTGWEHHGGECYYFSNTKLTWKQSREECISIKGDLVIINSKKEQKFLEHRLRRYMVEAEDKFWIGLTDETEEKSWLWVDGSALDQNISFWMNNEPDNWKGITGTSEGENCARMGEKGGALDLKCWFDAFCDRPHKWICETRKC